MKKSIVLLVTLNLLICLPILMGAWDKDKPSADTTLKLSNPEILANFSALESAIGQDHEFSTGGTNSGKHIQVTFDDPLSSAPSTVSASEGVLYLLDVSSKAELHFEDEDEHTLQLTSGGNLYSSTNLTVAGTSTFTGAVTANGGITLGAGDDLIGSSTSDITFNTNKFTVAGATGNTLVSGTLDVSGNIDPTTFETTNGGFLDEDDMASDSATKIASQQSIKAYVDALTTMLPAISGAGTGYTGGESVTFQNGLIVKFGVVTAGTTGTAVTFGTAFPTGFVAGFATPNNSDNLTQSTGYSGKASVDSGTTTGMNVSCSGSCYWLAIGY